MGNLNSRLARLEQERGTDLPRMIIVQGAATEAEARLFLADQDIEVKRDDMVFEQPGPKPCTVDIRPQTMCHEDILALLD